MPDEKAKLKLGKGVAFVKTRLRQLRLNDDIWEADFGLLDDGVTWLGLVVCPTSGAIFASEICDHPPDVNDLANLLAHAMRRPSIGYSRRPSRIRLHDNSAWDELIPHLHELGIEVEAAKRLKSYQSAMQEFRHELRKDRPTEEATSGDIENSHPAIAQWVQGCGWIEIGDQEGLGFTVRALDLGGVVFEDTECRSLTEAMASLEFGLAVAMKELGIN
ncbi:MAG: hypothetical protein WCK86_14865 [Planctomycetia bacterium]